MVAPRRVVWTIAGFDPSSGAGITADLQTFAAHGFFSCSAPTALTVQSTLGVRRVEPVTPGLLRQMLQTLEEDLPAEGIKIGMLANAGLASVVCDFLIEVRARRRVLVVLDPVLRSSSGAKLLDADGVEVVLERLLALCDVATPNRGELFALAGLDGEKDFMAAAAELSRRFPTLQFAVTGGDGANPDDVLVKQGSEPVWVHGERIDTKATHGTGCAYSSALLCRLLRGDEFGSAARGAKAYVEGALRSAPGVGRGRGPMDLLWTRPLLRSL